MCYNYIISLLILICITTHIERFIMKVIATHKSGTSFVQCNKCHAMLEVTIDDLTALYFNYTALCSFTCENCGSKNIIPTSNLSDEFDALL